MDTYTVVLRQQPQGYGSGTTGKDMRVDEVRWRRQRRGQHPSEQKASAAVACMNREHADQRVRVAPSSEVNHEYHRQHYEYGRQHGPKHEQTKSLARTISSRCSWRNSESGPAEPARRDRLRRPACPLSSLEQLTP